MDIMTLASEHWHGDHGCGLPRPSGLGERGLPGPAGHGEDPYALGVAAIHAGWRVRFTTAVALGQELLQAHSEARLPKALKTWDRFDLVILDELGYLGLGPAGPLLFQFCAHRYERGSLLITTNLEFSRWVEVFGDAALTSALLDRLTHRSHVLLFNGESYRFRESQQRLRKEGPHPDEPLNPMPGWSTIKLARWSSFRLARTCIETQMKMAPGVSSDFLQGYRFAR